MLRLLLVDDEYIELKAMQMIIEKNFDTVYEIKTAANGLEAIEIAKTFEPHLIFMDIKMPGCSGIEATRKIRAFLPYAKVVFMTAYDYFDYAKEAISLNAEEFLLKPARVDTIIELIKKLTSKTYERLEEEIRRQQIENKFEQITRQIQVSFIDLLGSSHSDKEQIEDYLKILNIKFYCGILVTINFSDLVSDETMSTIQKNFLRSRNIEKIRTKSRELDLTIISGNNGNETHLLFVIEEERTDLDEVFLELQARINETMNNQKLVVQFGISEPVYLLSDLSKALKEAEVKAYKTDESQKDRYPYRIEKEVINAIHKLDFEVAILKIEEIAKILQDEYRHKSDFQREVVGLYMVIKRILRQKFGNNTTYLEKADLMIENVCNYTTMIFYFRNLIEEVQNFTDSKTNKNEQLIRNICEYIENNYKKEISLEEAASQIGFSTFYFTKLMKEYLDMSFVDYLISVRVGKAKELFDTTSMSIKEVGFEVGYEDPNYFARVFKKVDGITPSAYKNRVVMNEKSNDAEE